MSQQRTFVNVAIGKPATQSSLSIYSKPDDAARAVSGSIAPSFAFHTGIDENPWWMVDLLSVYTLDRIVVHNRLDSHWHRAANCVVEISVDGQSWTLVHAGMVHFKGGEYGSPLTLPMGGLLDARFVRVSLPEKGQLHLSQVEVFADYEAGIRKKHDLQTMFFAGDFSSKRSADRNRAGCAYRVVTHRADTVFPDVIGLKLTNYGRLGNHLTRIINATIIARRLGLKYVVVNRSGLIQKTEPIAYQGLTYLSDMSEADESGAFIEGHFYFREDLQPVIHTATNRERYDIIKEFVRPRLMPPLPVSKDVKYDDELTIHLRSGDIFVNATSLDYSQPPLSFYKLVLRDLLNKRLIGRVRLVFEDRANPCIEALMDFLDDKGVPYRVQNGTLVEDLAALIDSRFLVFGFGSFGNAVCLLSEKIEAVYLFDNWGAKVYLEIPSIGRVVRVKDRDGGYMRGSVWRNTPEQRRLMVEYPESSLEIMPD